MGAPEALGGASPLGRRPGSGSGSGKKEISLCFPFYVYDFGVFSGFLFFVFSGLDYS
jgi:hypothetical protein